MYDVIIIGSGPAGYTAALYTARAFLKTLLFSGIQPGGQLTTTTEIENFPGFPKGIQGTQLMVDMKAQVERFSTEIKQEIVNHIEKKEKTFVLQTETASDYHRKKRLRAREFLPAPPATDFSSGEKKLLWLVAAIRRWKKQIF